jgi:O-antigen/teichoic acid export membrane protein
MSRQPFKSASSADQKQGAIPEGTISIGIGLLIAGVTIYIFFKIGQQALGQEEFKPLVSLWFVMFAIAPGFFLPVEQELSRAIAHRRALGQGTNPVVRKVALLCVAIVVFLVALILVLSPIINDNLFEDQAIITASLAIAIISYGLLYFTKGLSSGLGKFPAYGFIVGADGAIRVVACTILLVAGVTALSAYSIIIVITPIIGVMIIYLGGQLRTDPGPPAAWSEITENLVWLLGGSIFAAALVNAGPITVDLLGDKSDAIRVTQFGNAVLLTRVPLFLFQAVQAALLPRLTRLAARGDLDEFKVGFRRLVVLVIGVGAFGIVGAFLLGPFFLDLVYGGGIDRRTLTLLALASAIYMMALAIAQAVIALRGHRHVALGWLLAFISYVVSALAVSDDLFLRVEVALVVSSAVALLYFVFGLKLLLRSGAKVDIASITQAVSERPIEP